MEPVYTASVYSGELIPKQSHSINCIKCFIMTLTSIHSIIGLGLIFAGFISLGYISIGSLTDIFEGLAVSLFLSGFILFVFSILFLVSVCNHHKCGFKLIIVIFSYILLFLAFCNIIIFMLGIGYYNGITLNLSESILNTTTTKVYDYCCLENSTLSNECNTLFTKDLPLNCDDYYMFYTSFLKFIKPYLNTIIIITGCSAFVNLLSFGCSCCLICHKKQYFYYKPKPQTLLDKDQSEYKSITINKNNNKATIIGKII